MGKQRRGAPDNWWRLALPHGILVAKSGPVASVLSVCVCEGHLVASQLERSDNGKAATRDLPKWCAHFSFCFSGEDERRSG